MPLKKKRISELEEANDMEGFYTIGYRIANGVKTSVRFGLEKLQTAYDNMVAIKNDTLAAIRDIRSLESTVESNEETRETAESRRNASEQVRQNDEAERVKEEKVRDAAEDVRISTEEARKAAEDIRQTKETERIAEENTRKADEIQRISDEESRQIKETIRQTEEDDRIRNENTRKNSEEKRVSNEEARVIEENKRKAEYSGIITNLQQADQDSSEQTGLAKKATDDANAAAWNANQNADLAKEKAALADAAASGADASKDAALQAAEEAEEAKQASEEQTVLARKATGDANEAAENANQKAALANDAAQSANSAATEINDKIKAAIDALVAGAPGALDTLNELSAALGNDPNFATTVANELNKKLNKSDLPTSLPANGGWANTAININNPGTVTLANATEQNSIQVRDRPMGVTINSIVKSVDFNWYSNKYSIGIIRGSSSDTTGFGIYYNDTLRFQFRYPDNKVYDKINDTYLATVKDIPDITGLMPKTGGAFAGQIQVPSLVVPYESNTWLNSAITPHIIQAKVSQTENGASGLYRVVLSNGNRVVFGGFGNETGFYGYKKSTIDGGINRTDWRTIWDADGNITHTGYIKAPSFRVDVKDGGIFAGTGDGADYGTNNVKIQSWYGIGFWSKNDNTCRTVINTRTGDISTLGRIAADKIVKTGSSDAYVLLGGGGVIQFTEDPTATTIAKRNAAGNIKANGFIITGGLVTQLLTANGEKIPYTNTNANGGTIVQRNANGQIYATYFYSSNPIENITVNQISSVFVETNKDKYHRKISLNGFKTALGSLPASDVYAWAKAATKPAYNFNEILDAGNININPGEAQRRNILCNSKINQGYKSRAAIGLTNPANRFSPVIISAGTDDAGTKWANWTFDPADKRIYNHDGVKFLWDSDVPAWSRQALPNPLDNNKFMDGNGNWTYPKILEVKDLRGTNTKPNGYADRKMTSFFWDQDHVTGNYYKSGLIFKGWENAHRVWQIYSGSGGVAETDIEQKQLFYRTGIGTTWEAPKKIAFTDMGYVMQEYIIDATTLDQNTYYPVVVTLNLIKKNRIEVHTVLSSSGIPTWCSHVNGFCTHFIEEAYGNGWGTNPNIERNIFSYQTSHIKTDGINLNKYPIQNVTQLVNNSVEVIYVRGGGKYRFYTNNDLTPTLYKTRYEGVSGQYAEPKPIANLDNNIKVNIGGGSSETTIYSLNTLGFLDLIKDEVLLLNDHDQEVLNTFIRNSKLDNILLTYSGQYNGGDNTIIPLTFDIDLGDPIRFTVVHLDPWGYGIMQITLSCTEADGKWRASGAGERIIPEDTTYYLGTQDLLRSDSYMVNKKLHTHDANIIKKLVEKSIYGKSLGPVSLFYSGLTRFKFITTPMAFSVAGNADYPLTVNLAFHDEDMSNRMIIIESNDTGTEYTVIASVAK